MVEFTGTLFVRQNLLAFIQQLVAFGSNLVLTVVLPIIMGASVFGVFSLATGFAYFLVGLYAAGFNFSVIYFVSRYYPKKKDAKVKGTLFYILKLMLIISILFSILLFLFSDTIAAVYSIPSLSLALKIVSPLIIFNAIVVLLSGFFIGAQKNQYSLIGNSINSIFLIFLPAVLFYIGYGIEGAVLGVVLAFIAASICLTFLLLFKFRKVLKKKSKKVEKKEIHSSVIQLSVISFLNLFLYWGILLLLGFFVPPEEVAFFKISLAWVMAAGVLIPISGIVVFSSVISLKSIGDKRKLRLYTSKVFQYGLIITCPMMFGLFLLGEPLIKVVYGSAFLPAAYSLQIIAWVLVAQYVTNVFFSYLTASKKLKNMSKIYIFSTIVGVLFSIPAMIYFGLLGASASFVFIYLLISILLYGPVYKDLKINISKYMYKPFIASILMAGLIYYFKPSVNSILTGIALIIGAMLFYFAVLYLIRGFTKEDVRLLKLVKG